MADRQGKRGSFQSRQKQNSKTEILSLHLIIASADEQNLRIGYGAAQILLEAGAHVTIISSSSDRVDEAVKRLDHPNVQGKVGDVRDEEKFIQLLVSLAPLDHVVFSAVDIIIRGNLAEADLDQAKHLFGVKFWGSVVIGKGRLTASIE